MYTEARPSYILNGNNNLWVKQNEMNEHQKKNKQKTKTKQNNKTNKQNKKEKCPYKSHTELLP